MKLNFDISSWSRGNTQACRCGIEHTYARAQIGAFEKQRDAVWLFIWDMAREFVIAKCAVDKYRSAEFMKYCVGFAAGISIDLIEESIYIKNLGGGIQDATTRKNLTPFRADLLIQQLKPVLEELYFFLNEKNANDLMDRKMNQAVKGAFDKLSTLEGVLLEVWFRAKHEDPFFSQRLGSDTELRFKDLTADQRRVVTLLFEQQQ